jgi:hypothetical protein
MLRIITILGLLCGCSESTVGLNGIIAPTPNVIDPYDDGLSLQTDPPLPVEICDSVLIETEEHPRPVDIIWAIDTSPSMSGEKEAVRTNINAFSARIQDSSIDVNVVLIANNKSDGGLCVEEPLGSGACPDDHNPPQLYRDYNWVGSHNALNRMIERHEGYSDVLRPNSVKYYAVVTDDHADQSAEEFIRQRDALDPDSADRWTFFGMYCAHMDRDGVYQTLVDETEGLHVELCRSTPDWAVVFERMEETILENRALACDMEIPPAPAGYEFAADKLNVDYLPGDGGTPERLGHVEEEADCGALGGWHYDDKDHPTRIQICSKSCETFDGDSLGTLEVQFGCSTTDLDES